MVADLSHCILNNATVKVDLAPVEGYSSFTQLKVCGTVCWDKHVGAEVAVGGTESVAAIHLNGIEEMACLRRLTARFATTIPSRRFDSICCTRPAERYDVAQADAGRTPRPGLPEYPLALRWLFRRATTQVP